jgi:hypothetical protein
VPSAAVGRAAAAGLVFLLFVLAAPRLPASLVEYAAAVLIGVYVLVLLCGPVDEPDSAHEHRSQHPCQFESHLVYLTMRGVAVRRGKLLR